MTVRVHVNRGIVSEQKRTYHTHSISPTANENTGLSSMLRTTRSQSLLDSSQLPTYVRLTTPFGADETTYVTDPPRTGCSSLARKYGQTHRALSSTSGGHAILSLGRLSKGVMRRREWGGLLAISSIL